MKWQNLLSLFLVSFLPYLISCGGTSETGNARIASLSGSILINDCDTSKVWVHLVNENYIPGTDTSEMVYKVIVDPDGEYEFNSVQWNNYYLYIKGRTQNLLRGPFSVSVPEIELGKDTLHYSSKVTVNIPDSADLDFVFIRGIPDLYNVISGQAVLPNAPEGSLEIIARSNQNSSKPLDSTDLKRTIVLDVLQGDTVSVGLHAPAPVFEKTPTTMSRSINLDCTRRYQDVLLVDTAKTGSLTFRILQAPSDLRLNASNGIISWTVPDSFINRALTIGVVAENSSGSSRSIWWTVTFHSSCTLSVSKPKPPTCQDSGIINKNIYFNVDSTDQKLKFQYRFHWGDSTISNWSTSLSAMHSYTKPGTYYVRLQTATIDTSAVSELSEPRMISIGKQNTTPTIQQRVIFSADTISTGQNLSISLANGSSDSFFTYIRFNDTLKTILTDTLPVSHSWNKPGDYPVFVISINRYLPDTLTDTCIIHVIATNKTDTAFPVITLIGTSDTTLSVNTVYQDPGATAMDDTDGDISQLIKVSTDLDASKPGTYYFSYTVEDAAGNTTTVKRKVVIE